MSITGLSSSMNTYSIGQMMSRMQTKGTGDDASSVSGEQKFDLSQLVSQLDTDGSGSLESAEIQDLADTISQGTGVSVDLTEFLASYDTNGDETLSEDEAVAALEANPPQGPPPPGGGGGSPGEDIVSSADSNGDGVISSDEAEGLVNIINDATGSSLNVEDFLSDYDSDGDGSLSSDEAVSAMDANRPQGAESSFAAENSGFPAAAMEQYMNIAAMGMNNQGSGDISSMMMGTSSQASINSVI